MNLEMEYKRDKNELLIKRETGQNKYHLEYPLYEEIYFKALSCIYKETGEQELLRKEPYFRPDSSNIIIFTGSRGSGKTTAMEQFCLMLRKNGTKLAELFQDICIEQNESFTKRNFQCLDVVELSMLEDKEDIFEITLAKMLHMVDSAEERDKTELKKLHFQFDKVYRSYNAVKYDRQMDEYGESSLSRLNNLSSSLGVKKDFEKLVEQCLIYLNGSAAQSILVIPFDDLDLNIKHGYEMLECIYRYMRIPNLVVLLTVDSVQLQYICKKYIVHSFKETERFDSQIEGHCEKLVTDFLIKTCPVDKRFYMPEINAEPILVSERDLPEKYDSVKMFIMKKYVRKTGVFYDAFGRKRHFCEPDTIRALISYNNLLSSLYDIDIYKNPDDNSYQKYQQNFNSLNADIIKRFAAERLDSDKLKMLNKLLNENISRWGRFFYKQYINMVATEDTEKYKNMSMEDVPYHYCDLLSCIYQWGRRADDMKPFIHVILALFSLRYTKEYVQGKWDQQHSDKADDRLRGLLGQSFGGEWINSILPLLNNVNGNYGVAYGYREGITARDIREQEYVCILPEKRNNRSRRLFNDIEYMLSWIKDAKVIETLEIIGMFFCNCKDIRKEAQDFSYDFSIATGRQESENGEHTYIVLKARLAPVIETVDFDAWGFVRTPADLKNTYRALHDGIVQGILHAVHQYFITSSKKEKIIRYDELFILSKLNQCGFYPGGQMENIDTAVPFYSLDLMYNVFKRMRQKRFQSIPPRIDINHAMEYMVDMYKKFGFELQKEIDLYEDASDGLKSLQTQFLENPFVDALLQKKDRLYPGFDKYFSELIESMNPSEEVEIMG